MVDVRRKPKETTSSLIRRFSKILQQTKKAKNIKSRQHFKRSKKTNREEKNAAIMRMALTSLRKRLEKMGQFSDDRFQEEKKKLKQTLDL